MAEGPIYLIACQGDELWPAADPSNNGGSQNLEVAEVAVPTGIVGAWEYQLRHNGAQQGLSSSTHGHRALLYFDTLFVFPGVRVERRLPSTTLVESRSNAASRFLFHEDPDDPADDRTAGQVVIGDIQSSSASIDVPRAYYGMVRLMSYIYAVGGHDGTAALGSVERIHQ